MPLVGGEAHEAQLSEEMRISAAAHSRLKIAVCFQAAATVATQRLHAGAATVRSLPLQHNFGALGDQPIESWDKQPHLSVSEPITQRTCQTKLRKLSQ